MPQCFPAHLITSPLKMAGALISPKSITVYSRFVLPDSDEIKVSALKNSQTRFLLLMAKSK